ncbi:Lrp/AsnC family transcriptional regulator [Candidatus Woesearchaeota archaeon]|jgi:DNA-binding Lrp family transcriptional regulator|nr:Lrp/AsnC family transcriptional regulator [Candidatus Woesearchaeota archaeon]
MKDIKQKLIKLFKEGYCTPQIARIAKKIKEPSTTIHYNIKKLEKEGAVRGYNAVFDYKEIGLGYCTYLFIRLNTENYDKSEDIAKQIAKYENVESVDIVTGQYEIIVKLRCKDSDDYYVFVQRLLKKYGIAKAFSMTSLKQVKTEFVNL